MTVRRHTMTPLNPVPLSSSDRLLLQAILTDAVEDWRWFCALGDLDELGTRAFPLLPMLYDKLPASTHEAAVYGRLAGVYRRTWYKNRLLQEQVTQALDALTASGVDPLVIGEAALAFGPFRRRLRMVDGLDLLISHDDLSAAQAELERAGWRRSSATPAWAGIVIDVSRSFIKQSIRLTLHWLLMPERAGGTRNDQPVGTLQLPAIAHPAARTVAAEITLAQLSSRSAPANHPVLLADAATVLIDRGSAFDWPTFVEMVVDLDVAHAARALLATLSVHDWAPVPGSVLQDLHAQPPRLGRVRRHYRRFTALNPDKGTPLHYLRYLQARWNLDRMADVPAYAWRRLWHKSNRLD